MCDVMYVAVLLVLQVVPDKIGYKNSSYNDFVCALPDNQCRYAGMGRHDSNSPATWLRVGPIHASPLVCSVAAMQCVP